MASPPAATVAHALSLYAEPLAAGRRVMVVGDASAGLGEHLASLGARIVHVYDPDPHRARAAAASVPRSVSVRELPAGDFDVRDGAFDFALVPDLGSVPDPAALLLRLRRLLGAQGAALVGARNPDAPRTSPTGRALGYYELFDLVSLQFESVRMIGELPFSGVAIVELGEADEDLAVSVETQLAGEASPPDAYLALASQRPVRLDPYTIVQLPARAVGDAGGASSEEFEETRIALTEARLRAELLDTQLAEVRGQLVQQTSQDEGKLARAAELESALREVGGRLRDTEARAGDNHVRAERMVHEIRKLEEELERQRDRNFRLTRDVEDEKKARTKAELELGMVRRSPELASARERVAYLEEAVRTAEAVVSSLQARVDPLEAAVILRNEQLALMSSEVEALRLEAAEMPSLRARAAQQLEAFARRAEASEERANQLEQELAQGSAQAEELASLEAALRERARAIHGLEQEVVRRERLVRELVAALEEAGGQVRPAAAEIEDAAARARVDELERENGELARQLDALAALAARREGDVQANAWRLAELEQQVTILETRPVAEPAPAAPEPLEITAEHLPDGTLSDALEQLDILRQALAQEHEARRRAESGEALTHARAELQRQAVLIEQLSVGRSS